MKLIQKTGLAAAIVLFFILPVCFASWLFAYSEEITLSGEKTRGPVKFTHEAHMYSLDCLDCHHVMENGENILDETDLEEDNPNILCGSCHTDKANILKREAFHYQCIGCHDANRRALQETGPTLCGECHVREREGLKSLLNLGGAK